jgi:hypothetical protein
MPLTQHSTLVPTALWDAHCVKSHRQKTRSRVQSNTSSSSRPAKVAAAPLSPQSLTLLGASRHDPTFTTHGHWRLQGRQQVRISVWRTADIQACSACCQALPPPAGYMAGPQDIFTVICVMSFDSPRRQWLLGLCHNSSS